MQQQKQLPEGEHHLLLPKAHVHLFVQVAVVSIGVLFFLFGIGLYVLSYGETFEGVIIFSNVRGEDVLLFSYLIAGLAMGSGLSFVLGWALWKYTKKNRFRFTLGLIVSTLSILAAFASVAIQDDPEAIHYTFYFFMISLGMLSGLISIFYFFRGLSRHIIPTHTHHELDNS